MSGRFSVSEIFIGGGKSSVFISLLVVCRGPANAFHDGLMRGYIGSYVPLLNLRNFESIRGGASSTS